MLKKINIGLVLAIITILIVTIYCISIGNNRNSEKQEIKKVCEDFINLTDRYSKLPESDQNILLSTRDVKQLNLDNYYSEIERSLKEKMKNDVTANIQKKVITDNIKNQLYDSSKVMVNSKREITKISQYDFDGNSVTVTFNSKLTIKQKYLEINEETLEVTEKIKESAIECVGESIALEKIDGTWKVVYANLQYYVGGELIV